MWFRLLGPVEIGDRAGPVRLGPAPLKVAAALALEANRVVTLGRLVDVLWDEDPPAGAAKSARNCVGLLRSALRRANVAAAVETTGAGYRLVVAAGGLDIAVFRAALEQADGLLSASGAGATASAAGALQTALQLWRGPALAGIASRALEPARVGLEELRLAAAERHAELQLDLGRHQQLVAPLSELTRQHPLREQLVGHLMLALNRCGRRADALAEYRRLRAVLDRELGLEPSQPLRLLHQRVLRSDLVAPIPVPAAAASAIPPTPAPVADSACVPVVGPPPVRRAGEPATADRPVGYLAEIRAAPAVWQLPADVEDFTGRAEELAAVTLGLRRDTSRTACPVVVISGQGGVGKTTLAVHAAHLLRGGFPDGQICLPLRATHPDLMSPEEALARALRALGAPSAARRGGLEEKIDQFRSALSGRRLLLILDDAATAAQVRPLLPGEGSCGVLITARGRLAGLDAARRVDLDVLGEADALTLLGRIIGQTRLDQAGPAATRLINQCARLPLAVRIAGARLLARPHWPLTRLVTRMDDERHRLDELSVEDREVRASLAVSYRGLDPAAARLFRLLGTLALPDFGGWLAAVLLSQPQHDTDELLDRLLDARLLDIADTGPAQPRYRMHDLIRLYADERAQAEDADRLQVISHALNTFTHLLEHHPGSPPAQTPVPHPLPHRSCAQRMRVPAAPAPDWFEHEEPMLIAAVERAAALDLTEPACALAGALAGACFEVHNRFEAWNRTHTAALTAARRAADTTAEAGIECGLGRLSYQQDKYTDALTHFHQALTLYEQGGDPHGQADALTGIATIHRELGQHHTAIPALTHAENLLAPLRDAARLAPIHYNLGCAHRELGHDHLALDHLHNAVAAYQQIGDTRGHATALRGIGLVHRARGELDQALGRCTAAHHLAAATRDPHLSCYTGQAVAKIWIRQGDPDRAIRPLHAALRACTSLRDRYGTALIQRTLGELHLAADRLTPAHQHLTTADQQWTAIGHALAHARTLRDLGAVHARRGNHTTAHHAWTRALHTFRALNVREAYELTTWRQHQGCHCPP
jgi:DNA-binding SARP family transcriptional activator/tetratricopeptide (TPR) repeat protein